MTTTEITTDEKVPATFTRTERAYIEAYTHVLHCVWSVELFISSSFAAQVERLEGLINNQARCEQLRELARWRA